LINSITANPPTKGRFQESTSKRQDHNKIKLTVLFISVNHHTKKKPCHAITVMMHYCAGSKSGLYSLTGGRSRSTTVTQY